MTAKDLKALAAACRKAGITHFKNSEIEFTLGDVPSKPTAKKKPPLTPSQEAEQFKQDLISSDGWDELTIEQKLNWSSEPLVESESN